MVGAFRDASDVDRLIAKRNEGGRGLRSIEDLYETMVGIAGHLEDAEAKHRLLKLVKEHEKKRA